MARRTGRCPQLAAHSRGCVTGLLFYIFARVSSGHEHRFERPAQPCLPHQLLDASASLVADRSDSLDGLPLGILARPIITLDARHDRTLR